MTNLAKPVRNCISLARRWQSGSTAARIATKHPLDWRFSTITDEDVQKIIETRAQMPGQNTLHALRGRRHASATFSVTHRCLIRQNRIVARSWCNSHDRRGLRRSKRHWPTIRYRQGGSHLAPGASTMGSIRDQ